MQIKKKPAGFGRHANLTKRNNNKEKVKSHSYSFRDSIVTVDELANLLDKAKILSDGSVRACCPGHEDRSPSLSAKLAPNGFWLFHCFAGCTIEEIISPIGLTLSQICGKSETNVTVTQDYLSRDSLEQIDYKCFYLGIAYSDINAGKRLENRDLNKVSAYLKDLNEVFKKLALSPHAELSLRVLNILELYKMFKTGRC